jgi:hypothetical protein
MRLCQCVSPILVHAEEDNEKNVEWHYNASRGQYFYETEPSPKKHIKNQKDPDYSKSVVDLYDSSDEEDVCDKQSEKNKNSKEIGSVEPGGCAQSYPCQHSLTIKYKDGSIEKEWAYGDEIAEKYFNYLNDRNQKHFSQYRSKLGFFTRWFNSKTEREFTQKDTPHQQI